MSAHAEHGHGGEGIEGRHYDNTLISLILMVFFAALIIPVAHEKTAELGSAIFNGADVGQSGHH